MKFIQHPSNNAVLGAPEGSGIEDVRALFITRVKYDDGSHTVASYWMPDDNERALIARGEPIRLTVLGVTMAPVKLDVGDA